MRGDGGLGYQATGSVKAYENQVQLLLTDSLCPLGFTQTYAALSFKGLGDQSV